jgi:hypothetical protein
VGKSALSTLGGGIFADPSGLASYGISEMSILPLWQSKRRPAELRGQSGGTIQESAFERACGDPAARLGG